ncbi:hypothetical protein AVEN_99062-1 [Araneus ventricosus]|uniref:PiggyBac transposable element-derived protein domain-containing protein n=1 Tax=Araneus ventricosus TaxID=182803 RepID=A0A4Y2FLV8_ARAVE|nr:hypothetical protein AVEN_99062-1 [Araneus ventricosus]
MVRLVRCTEGSQDSRSSTVEDCVLDRLEEDPSVSSRLFAYVDVISQNKVMKTLHENQYHSYPFTQEQELRLSDFQQQVRFCRWLLELDIEEQHFLKTIMWTDESLFTRDDISILQN